MRWSDFSRKARNVFDRHVKKIIIAAVFAVSLFFILESKRLSGLPSAAQDSWTIGILLDLGTGALVSVLIFIAFDQIYQNVGRLNRLRTRPQFDYMHVLKHEFPKLKNVKSDTVIIMDNWLPFLRTTPEYGYDETASKTFEDQLRSINESLVSRPQSLTIKVLVLHPESAAAEVRHQQRLGSQHGFPDVNPLKDMRRNARELRKLMRTYTNIGWEIRLSKVPLLMDLYITDELTVQGFFPPRNPAANHRHLYVPKVDHYLGDFGRYVEKFFDEVFSDVLTEGNAEYDATLVDLEDYWRLKDVTLTYYNESEGETLTTKPFSVKYVYLRNKCYLQLYEYHPDYLEGTDRNAQTNRNREKMSPKDEETLRRLLLGKGRFSVRLPNLGQPFDTHTQDAATSRSYRARLVVTDKNAKGYEKSLCLDLRKLIQAKYDPYDKDTRQVKHIVELDFTGVPDEEFRRAFCKNPGLRYVKPPLTQPLYLLEPLDLIHFSNGVPEQASAADLSATKPSVSDVNVASSGDQPIGSHV